MIVPAPPGHPSWDAAAHATNTSLRYRFWFRAGRCCLRIGWAAGVDFCAGRMTDVIQRALFRAGAVRSA